MKQIILKDAVRDTYTNIAGASLALQIKSSLTKGDSITVSFTDSTPLSSSFFNSSFGELIGEFGYQKVKDSIRIVSVSGANHKLLRDYFNAYKDSHHC